jgi:hypothetical protein
LQAFVSDESHGIQDLLADCDAALMGRTKFEPALTHDRWPWSTLKGIRARLAPAPRHA